jgi:hypothetical protein
MNVHSRATDRGGKFVWCCAGETGGDAAGKKFDPELVSIFVKMEDVLTAIAKEYS